MQPRITVLTLAVENLKKSVQFYRDGLGFPTEGIIGQEFENGAVAFFDLNKGLKLALWPRESLCRDTQFQFQSRNPTELAWDIMYIPKMKWIKL